MCWFNLYYHSVLHIIFLHLHLYYAREVSPFPSPPVAALLSSLLLVDIRIVFLVFPTPPFVESSIPISAVGGKSNPKVVI